MTDYIIAPQAAKSTVYRLPDWLGGYGVRILRYIDVDFSSPHLLVVIDDGSRYQGLRLAVPTAELIEAKPRTWSLPPEPGPEVTAVRDHDGDLWHRDPDGWWRLHRKTWSGTARQWGELLEFGPLTDATNEP